MQISSILQYLTYSKIYNKNWNVGFPTICTGAADFALLNLPKGKSLGRSKPETNSSNEQAH
jgi:hypothetical protein